MEVHSHTHTPRKKWTHYFWEFLMLFLAVFCGFLAENQREHMIEHQREKKYIASLVKDLELDIATLQSSYESEQVQLNYYDSLILLLKQGFNNQMSVFYFYSRHISRNNDFQYHDRTIQQLKNSGNLRLIRNADAADSITVYDNEAIKKLSNQQDAENELRKQINWNLIGKIFDPVVWAAMTDKNSNISRPIGNPSLKTTDPALINEFHFKVVQLRGTILFTSRNIKNAIVSAQNLIALLKKEYHLQ